MKVLEFATYVTAVANNTNNTYVETEVRQDTWKTCETDTDCLYEHSCVRSMWKSNEGDFSSNRGCQPVEKCAGTGTWRVEDYVLQYFCNEEQIAKGNDMDPLTWAKEVPKEWSKFEQACNEKISCPEELTCMSERFIYGWTKDTLFEWDVGHGCYNNGTKCEGGYAEMFFDETEGNLDYSYWEVQCDLDFPTEAYNANSSAMKSASIATFASLIALSSILF